MDLREIKYFHEIVKAGNFARAAENLYISQPALSKAIKKLESEIGFALFQKQGTRKLLSPKGQAFLKQSAPLLAAEAQLQEWLQHTGRPQHKQIHIGIISHYSTPIATDLFYQFKDIHPEVELLISEMPESWIRDRLLSGEIDVGIAANSLQGAGIALQAGFEDTVAVAVSHHSPLWDHTSVSFQELREEMFHMITSDNELYQQILNGCKEAGYQPKIGYQGSQVGLLLSRLAQKGGVLLLSSAILQSHIDSHPAYRELRMLPLKPALLFHSWVITRNSPRLTPEVSAFVKHVIISLDQKPRVRIC